MIEILTIGTELLLGATVDTNAAFLGERLSSAGFRVSRRTTVGDDPTDIREVLMAALARSRCVICTGGLGPTPDDLTRPVAAGVYGVELRLDQAWLEVMARRFQARGLVMPAINRNQALVPAGATVFSNSRGTAPGLALHDDALGTTVLLPGVPAELRTLFEEQVLPYLSTRLGPQRPILSRTVRTTGIAESALAERLAGVADDLPQVTLAFLPTPLGTDLRLTCWGDPGEGATAASLLLEGERRLRDRAREYIYGTDRQDLAAVLGGRLREHGLRLAVAESCTGGLLAGRITDVPGSSDYFLGGVIAYANDVKRTLAGVTTATLRTEGAVSEAVALELAGGVAGSTGADCTIAVTGIAGPGGGTAEKPVGTVWIAVQVQGHAQALLHRFGGTREEIRVRAAQAALAMLLRTLDLGLRPSGPESAHAR